MNTDTQVEVDKSVEQEETKELYDKYKVLDKIGRGGCSKVFEAIRRSDGYQVALKLLYIPDNLTVSEAHLTLRRFYAEARVLQTLTDSHSVHCFDYGVYKGTPCYVMDLVSGIQLNDYLRNTGALSFEVSVSIMKQVMSVLAQAHENGIIHRDIKPENILVLPETDPIEIKLIDFGIASIQDKNISGMQATKPGVIRGTPSYMAPELFSGYNKATAQSDIYACGLVMLECLTGNIAVPGTTVVDIAKKHTEEDLVIPAFIPECLREIIWKCCAKAPEDRYNDCHEIISDLEEALPHACKLRSELNRAYYGTLPETKAFAKRSKKAYIIFCAAMILAIGVGVMAFLKSQNSAEAALQSQNTQSTAAPAPAASAQEMPAKAAAAEEVKVAAEDSPIAAQDDVQPQPPQEEIANAAAPSEIAPAVEETPSLQPEPSAEIAALIPAPEMPTEENSVEEEIADSQPEVPADSVAQAEEAPAPAPVVEAKPAETKVAANTKKTSTSSKSKSKSTKSSKSKPKNTQVIAETPKPKATSGKKVDAADIPLSIF